MLTDSIFFGFFSSNKKLSLNVNKCNLGNSNYYKLLGVKFGIKLSLEQIYVKILVEKYAFFKWYALMKSFFKSWFNYHEYHCHENNNLALWKVRKNNLQWQSCCLVSC